MLHLLGCCVCRVLVLCKGEEVSNFLLFIFFVNQFYCCSSLLILLFFFCLQVIRVLHDFLVDLLVDLWIAACLLIAALSLNFQVGTIPCYVKTCSLLKSEITEIAADSEIEAGNKFPCIKKKKIIYLFIYFYLFL